MRDQSERWLLNQWSIGLLYHQNYNTLTYYHYSIISYPMHITILIHYSLVLLSIGFSRYLIYIGMLSIHLDSQKSVVNHYVVDHQIRKVEIIYVNISLASAQLCYFLSIHHVCIYPSISIHALSINQFTHIFIHPFTSTSFSNQLQFNNILLTKRGLKGGSNTWLNGQKNRL